MKKQFENLAELQHHADSIFKDELIQKEYDKLHERIEDRVLHSATVRDEIRRGIRISDESIEVTMYDWVQRFLSKADRYRFIEDISVNGVLGRAELDLLNRRLQFEPYYGEKEFIADIKKTGITWNSEDSWSFGSNQADGLARLSRDGIKRATSSLYYFYEMESEELPAIGDRSLILYENKKVCCAIETTKVSIVPFNQVTAEHAFLEGEGDRSLRYWSILHEVFFRTELKEYKEDFNYDRKVVCEEFKCLFTSLNLAKEVGKLRD